MSSVHMALEAEGIQVRITQRDPHLLNEVVVDEKLPLGGDANRLLRDGTRRVPQTCDNKGSFQTV